MQGQPQDGIRARGAGAGAEIMLHSLDNSQNEKGGHHDFATSDRD